MKSWGCGAVPFNVSNQTESEGVVLRAFLVSFCWSCSLWRIKRLSSALMMILGFLHRDMDPLPSVLSTRRGFSYRMIRTEENIFHTSTSSYRAAPHDNDNKEWFALWYYNRAQLISTQDEFKWIQNYLTINPPIPIVIPALRPDLGIIRTPLTWCGWQRKITAHKAKQE